ncbi:MAG TPA: hypothetical protein DCS88_02280 [Alphaproteobacteria bacterium]|nr:hypothetical protein [Alphaproteobacteria bacterium]
MDHGELDRGWVPNLENSWIQRFWIWDACSCECEALTRRAAGSLRRVCSTTLCWRKIMVAGGPGESPRWALTLRSKVSSLRFEQDFPPPPVTLTWIPRVLRPPPCLLERLEKFLRKSGTRLRTAFSLLLTPLHFPLPGKEGVRFLGEWTIPGLNFSLQPDFP